MEGGVLIFQNRSSAGKQLAKELKDIKGDLLVMGLARGGVVVAAEIASELNAPLSPMIIQKIGAPGNPELALGAVAESGPEIFNEELITLLGVSNEYLKKETALQREKIMMRKTLYFGGKAAIDPKDKTVILVDDGIATGASMKVAIASLKELGTKNIIVAVPVVSKEALACITKLIDQVVYLLKPVNFYAVGAFYKEFSQVSDEEVVTLIGGQ